MGLTQLLLDGALVDHAVGHAGQDDAARIAET